MPTALVTGAAGFIGQATCRRLLADGYRVIGLDAMTDYYDVALKERREAALLQSADYRSIHAKVEDDGLLMSLFAEEKPDVVIHLAAQAGVRYSIDHKLQEPEELKNFDYDGYNYNPELSQVDRWVFCRV